MIRKDERSMISIHVDDDLKRAVKVKAAEDKRSITEIVTKFLKEYLRQGEENGNRSSTKC